MRNSFKHYYNPASEILDQAVENGMIVFDTNVLFDVYRIGSDFIETFFKVFGHESVKDRIILPRHAAWEYHNDYLRVLYGTKDDLEKFEKNITDFNVLKDVPRWLHADIKQSLVKDYEELKNKYVAKIEAQIKSIKEELSDRSIQERMATLFEGKLLQGFTEKEKEDIAIEGEERYKNNIPPGHKDSGKPDNMYGDLIIWKEILRYAQENKDKDILFISEDEKEDWLLKVHGEKRGLRIELLDEFAKHSERLFHRYNLLTIIDMLDKKFNILSEDESTKAKTDFVEYTSYPQKRRDKAKPSFRTIWDRYSLDNPLLADGSVKLDDIAPASLMGSGITDIAGLAASLASKPKSILESISPPTSTLYGTGTFVKGQKSDIELPEENIKKEEK